MQYVIGESSLYIKTKRINLYIIKTLRHLFVMVHHILSCK